MSTCLLPACDPQAAVQASEAELEAELQSIGAVDVGQGWQGIDPDYLATLLQACWLCSQFLRLQAMLASDLQRPYLGTRMRAVNGG